MKKSSHKNGIVITALALMIIAAGYLNFTGQKISTNGITARQTASPDVVSENAAELMLQAKGFENAIVSISDGNADVVISSEGLTNQQIAQIEDIVKRKTGIAADKIVITPVNMK